MVVSLKRPSKKSWCLLAVSEVEAAEAVLLLGWLLRCCAEASRWHRVSVNLLLLRVRKAEYIEWVLTRRALNLISVHTHGHVLLHRHHASHGLEATTHHGLESSSSGLLLLLRLGSSIRHKVRKREMILIL